MEITRTATIQARRELILREVLAGKGHVDVLSRELGVSTATVRRDLQLLVSTGLATRTYGGAVAGPRPLESSLRQKEVKNQSEKRLIARKAAGLVREGDTLILDAGSTVERLASELARRRNLTVITNGVSSLFALVESDEINVIVLGGELRHISQALVGPLAELTLAHIGADKVFLGAEGVTEKGVCCPSLAVSSLKRLFVEAAREIYVLADHSKLGFDPYHYWVPLDHRFTLVTDSGADDAVLARLRARGVSVLVAHEAGPRS